jgi:hypothetical protein
VRYSPISSVPYFDDRCGLTFRNAAEFTIRLPDFLALLDGGRLAPRDYILENLTLEKCARDFVNIVKSVS